MIFISKKLDLDDLFQTIAQKTSDQSSIQDKEKGLILLGLLLDDCGEFMEKYFMTFHKFFLKTLKDKSVEYLIRKETMRCLVFMID